MLSGQLLVGVSSSTVYGGAGGGLSVCKPLLRGRRSDVFWVSAIVNNHDKKQQNHYSILGVSSSASSADIKKAYRLLARKWHPDVSKDSRAGEVFKNIHLAYQVLSNEATRVQYDRVLKADEYASDPISRNTYHESEYEDVMEPHEPQVVHTYVRRKRQEPGKQKDMHVHTPTTSATPTNSVQKQTREQAEQAATDT